MNEVTLKIVNEMTELDDINAEYVLEELVKALLKELDELFGPEEPIDAETEAYIKILLEEGNDDE